MSSTIRCLPHQAKFIQSPFIFDDVRFFFLIAGYASGKGLLLTNDILTPSGFKKNGDLQLGDEVVSPVDGKAYKIDGIFPQGMKQTYRVYFSDSTSTVCDENHLWAVQDTHGRQRKRPFHVIDMQELLKWKLFTVTKHGDKIKNCFVPVNCPVTLTDYHESAAYAIGNFLADGCCNDNTWVIREEDVLERVRSSLASRGFELKKMNQPSMYRASIHGRKSFSGWLYEEYGITGKANQKRIPKKLLHADLETRRNLLAGLVDGDGSTQSKSRMIDYTCVSKGLIEDIKFLARSLGVVVNERSERIPEYTWNGEKRRGQTAYRISFSCPEEVKLSKKHTARLASFKGKTKDYKAIVKIEKDIVQETQCIHIDSPDHLYIVDDWIVTHNTSSLAYSLFYIINYLSGYKDKEGKLPLIAVSATTLTFLKKTLVGSITSLLDSSKSPYKYDKANNILTISGVQIILLATEDESAIYGYSVYCFHGDTQVPVLFNGGVRFLAIKDVKKGMHTLTREGWKRVKNAWCSGKKKCIRLTINGTDIVCTPDHPFITERGTVAASDIKEGDVVYQIPNYFEDLKQINTRKPCAVPVTVKTLKEEELSEVYDLEVEDAHEFYANGILVHNCSICDELDELPTDNAMAVVKALNDRTRQIIPDRRPPFLMFGTTSQGLKGTYLTVDEFKKKGISHLVIRGATKDNIYLPKEFVEAMYKIYDDKETACLLEGKFIAIDTGRVFPQFDMAKHYLPYDMWDSLPAGSTVYLAQDFNQGSGFNKAIAVYVQDGVAYVVKEYDFPDWTTAPKVFRSDFRTQKLFWIPDMTYKDNFTMASRSLQAYNIRPVFKKSNPLVSDRNFAINACFHSERLFVCHFCKDAADAFMHWQNDKRTGQPSKGKTSSSPDHYGDCLGYAMYHIICNERSFKDIFDTTLNRLNKKRSEQGFVTTNGLLLREVSPANKD